MKYILPLCALLLLAGCKNGQKTADPSENYEQQSPAFQADSAMAYVKAQCDFGPRTMNSPQHEACGEWIAEKFRQFGATVALQKGTANLYDGTPVSMTNIIASYNPDAEKRILICAHWDSRPWADHDGDEALHHTPIDGANDGASGVGVMLEMARIMQQQMPKVGVDFVCFDAEDCGTPEWAEQDDNSERTWCLGSQHYAANFDAANKPAFAILLDMVGGANTHFQQEGFSANYAQWLVAKVWAKAHLLGFGDYFLYEQGGYVTDDHLPLLQAGITAIDIIGSDRDDGHFCKTWHTTSDTAENIDQNILRAVGQTVLEVIYTTE